MALEDGAIVMLATELAASEFAATARNVKYAVCAADGVPAITHTLLEPALSSPGGHVMTIPAGRPVASQSNDPVCTAPVFLQVTAACE